MTLRLHIQRPEDWRQARDIRLAMLADTPIAYLDTLKAARQRSDTEWRQRHQRRFGPDGYGVAVVDDGGEWRGQMFASIEPVTRRRAWLLAVWVHPDFRGAAHRAAAMMLDEIVAWVRGRGLDRLWLEVHESNGRAIAFYSRHGFVMTGTRRPYPLDERSSELEMSLDLPPG